LKSIEEYLRAMRAKLEESNADIDALTNKASDGSAKLRIRLNLVSSKQL
jgi:hypothetical protein